MRIADQLIEQHLAEKQEVDPALIAKVAELTDENETNKAMGWVAKKALKNNDLASAFFMLDKLYDTFPGKYNGYFQEYSRKFRQEVLVKALDKELESKGLQGVFSL